MAQITNPMTWQPVTVTDAQAAMWDRLRTMEIPEENAAQVRQLVQDMFSRLPSASAPSNSPLRGTESHGNTPVSQYLWWQALRDNGLSQPYMEERDADIAQQIAAQWLGSSPEAIANYLRLNARWFSDAPMADQQQTISRISSLVNDPSADVWSTRQPDATQWVTNTGIGRRQIRPGGFWGNPGQGSDPRDLDTVPNIAEDWTLYQPLTTPTF